MPGSGTSRLGRALVEELSPDITTEHISVGNRIRQIGRGALHSPYQQAVLDHLNGDKIHTPLHDEIVYGIVVEALERYDETQLILLDGYPRYQHQVEASQLLAIIDWRTLHGMIITETDTETALARMILRGERDVNRTITPAQASDRLDTFLLSFEAVKYECERRHIPIKTVDTGGSRTVSTHLGLQAVKDLLDNPTLHFK